MPFHGNSSCTEASQCCVICTSPVLFKVQRVCCGWRLWLLTPDIDISARGYATQQFMIKYTLSGTFAMNSCVLVVSVVCVFPSFCPLVTIWEPVRGGSFKFDVGESRPYLSLCSSSIYNRINITGTSDEDLQGLICISPPQPTHISGEKWFEWTL